jgi:hypothetical protein
MARSVVASAPFKQTTLEFRTEGTFPDGVDDYGNPKFKQSPPTKLTALIAPYKFDMLRRQPGADPKLIPCKGELVDPLESSLLQIGAECRLEFQGSPATLKISNVIQNDVIGVPLGDAFQGEILLD